MYDDRPLFLSSFYSDTLFGLVMQNVKELICLGGYLIQLTLPLQDPCNFASFVSDIYFRADFFCDFTPQIFLRSEPLHDQRSHRSGTCEHLCQSSRR